MTSSDLVWLTAAEARRLLDQKDISSVELTEAHLNRIDKIDGPIHSYLHVMAESPRTRPPAAERESRGEAGLLPEFRSRSKTCSARSTPRPPLPRSILEGYQSPYDATVVRRLAQEARCSSARPTPTSSRWAHRPKTRLYRRHPQSLGSRSRVPAAAAAVARRRSRPAGDPLARLRHRRLDPPAGRVLRRRRAEADLRPGLPLRADRLRLEPGSDRPVHPHGRGRRDRCSKRSPATTRATRPQRRCRCRIIRAALTGDIRGMKIGVAAGVSRRRHGAGRRGGRRARRSTARASWAPRSSRSVCRTPKYALPTYYITAPAEASANLARLRRREVRLVDRGADRCARCTSEPAARASAPR